MSHQPLPGDHSNSARSGADHHIPNPDATYSADYAPYPKLDANDFAPALDPLLSNPPYSVPTAPPQSPADGTISLFPESNPYVSSAPAPPSATKNPMESVKGVLEKWGKKAADATKKAEGLASDVWQHLKTSPNVADAAVARIAQGTKVLTEGGYEKVFRQAFETSPEEQLKKYYACYLSTSAGPVSGTIYLSTIKFAFCSDSPLSYKVGERTEWSYYKVVIPLHQIRVANPSTSKVNPAEKYIRIITVDNHEFWFMGFVNYESAVKNLQGVSPSP